MDFVIYRGSWRCNGNSTGKVAKEGMTYLLSASRRMCVLGQVCYQLGVPLSAMEDVFSPTGLPESYWLMLRAHGLICNLIDCDLSDFARLAIRYNDLRDESVVEQRLTNLFEREGYTLRFEDGVAPWFEPVKVISEGWDPLVDEPPSLEEDEDEEEEEEEEEEEDEELVGV